GGNPVASRAGLAVLDVIQEENLQERARTVGDYLREELEALKQRHLSIGEVRGRGLMVGVELSSDDGERRPLGRLAHSVMNRMKDNGVLVGSTGPHGNVLKIRPPLVLTTQQARLIVEALDGALGCASDPQG
ncbi:MAG TPA: aminotransferase class III-fold pyridoxal phosphate-dependent enzyme, partial [Actinomycetota bacterium]|nr:aminotransferase class III-fold pyridoxal phosphate-dependent enzyme [Actinomycetota bacterium]